MISGLVENLSMSWWSVGGGWWVGGKTVGELVVGGSVEHLTVSW